MPFAIEAPQRTDVFMMIHLDWPLVVFFGYSGNIRESAFAAHVCRMVSGSSSTLPGASRACFRWQGLVHELTPLIDEVGYRCGGCGRVQTFMKVCGNCRFVRYCSEACQRRCWRAHRRSCHATRRVYDRSRRRNRPNYYGYMSGYEFHKWFHCLHATDA